ncbi:MAG: thioredoxin domain-containing protein [Cenarchaeum sp. SB0665_bin_23]|nr:thioredoxin domain-containing protein [Cenarchaeum sp. SB0664_bin_35]MXY61053.1 thioredoxin domain-containing protein [Cenarchaeum sp. SB0665_bin_23]MXZ94269.1 thioredoxin domain-containing protein [Cenarchaeum sp. SB0666_bin_15]MYB46826.1 thioredoxin domain-containing protein [Cenarchaeum sp. SB0662_bin_33]MYD58567.1 thioredoxin domain-containing protein [Cenarchaeum sp. SB0678_bin_8]MYG33068.1 thioredoxin domain-containing protein [Cenarchaeum sp. SB0677_bin_16]MYJ27583.1 thioredoxin dom
MRIMKMYIMLAAAVAVAGALIAYTISMQDDTSMDIRTASLMSALTDNASPVMGDPDAPIILVEFGDYQCHFCHQFFVNTKDRLVSNYIDTGKVVMMFKDFTIIGPDSISAAEGAHCAQEQDLYWEYHDTLYHNWDGENTGWASTDNLHSLAAEAGLDVDAWSACLYSGRYSDTVSSTSNDARALGITGTPSFFVILQNQTVVNIPGAQPYEQFAQVFDSILE